MGVQPQCSLSGWRNMIYWFLQLATSDALAQGVDVKTQSVHCLGGGTCSPGGSSPGPEEVCACLDSPPPHRRVRPARAPALQRRSRRARGQVWPQADFPPPPLIQFFLQATFSCVAAASCRVARSSSLVLATSSLRCGSCSGISCGQKGRFVVRASSLRFSARSPHLGLPAAHTFSVACFCRSPGVTRTKSPVPTPAPTPSTAPAISALRRVPMADRATSETHSGASSSLARPPRRLNLRRLERLTQETIETGPAREGLARETFRS